MDVGAVVQRVFGAGRQRHAVELHEQVGAEQAQLVAAGVAGDLQMLARNAPLEIGQYQRAIGAASDVAAGRAEAGRQRDGRRFPSAGHDMDRDHRTAPGGPSACAEVADHLTARIRARRGGRREEQSMRQREGRLAALRGARPPKDARAA